MPVQNDRYEQVRLLLEKQEIKIKGNENRDGFEVISLENCIFDASHKQATIVFHPTRQMSYVCHTLACKGRTWDQAIAKLEGKSLENIQQFHDAQILAKTEKQNGTMPVMLMKVAELKANPLNKILPPLTPEQRQGLMDRIEQFGFNEAIEITPTHFLLDGHNRIEIAKHLGISELPAVIINIPPEEQEIYIIKKNFSRRQLTLEQQSYLRGKIYQQEKKIVGAPQENQNAAQNNVVKIATLNSESEEDTASTSHNLAEKFHVSARTIRNDARFAKSIDTLHEVSPEFEQKILSREKINGRNITKKNVIEIAEKIAEKKENQEPVPQTEEEILSLVDKKKQIISEEKNIAYEEPPLEVLKSSEISLTSLLEEILDRIQRVRSHKDFPHEVMEKLNHIEEETTTIIRIVSAKGEEGYLKSERDALT